MHTHMSIKGSFFRILT